MTRDGKRVKIHPNDIVVGDVVEVKGGDEIPGDALLLNGQSVMCDESAMTGESDVLDKVGYEICIEKKQKLVESGKFAKASKHEVPSPLMLSGTSIKNGTGHMLVISVGDYSSIGKIRATLADKDDDATPMQIKLAKMANNIGFFGLTASLSTVLIMVIRAFYDMIQTDEWFNGEQIEIIVSGFLIAITVIVVAIPEGLPLAVTISLALSVKKMLADENLVRKFHACETMGSATYICSDKTGTLTLNQMYMIKFWNFESHDTYTEKKTGMNKDGRTPIIKRDPLPYEDWVCDAARESFEIGLTVNSMTDPKEAEGNPTDLAITRYMYLEGKGVDACEMREKYPKIKEEPFNSDRKRMSSFVKNTKGEHMIVMKGASELVLGCCDNIIDLKTGEKRDLDTAARQEALEAINNYAVGALRTIAVCYKMTNSYDKDNKDKNGVLNDEKTGFTLIGISGIRDVIRTEVPDAVAQCNKAGIQVKMVTGDNQVTAKAIAMDCNIISRDGKGQTDRTVMLGSDFYDYVGGIVTLPDPKDKSKTKYTVKHQDKFKEIYHEVQVLARSRPQDKLTMVVGLKENGHVVAVTGDGTNDAPALSKANVGFAMGKTGTDIAKQAADILLTTDNFCAIVSAVKWGRNIYDSIRKFLQF